MSRRSTSTNDKYATELRKKSSSPSQRSSREPEKSKSKRQSPHKPLTSSVSKESKCANPLDSYCPDVTSASTSNSPQFTDANCNFIKNGKSRSAFRKILKDDPSGVDDNNVNVNAKKSSSKKSSSSKGSEYNNPFEEDGQILTSLASKSKSKTIISTDKRKVKSGQVSEETKDKKTCKVTKGAEDPELLKYVPSGSGSKSSSKDKYKSKSKTNLIKGPKVPPLKVGEVPLGNKEIDSLGSSIEGTPVMLSREGSRIRIADEETGEVFFIKRTKSRDYKGTKQTVFVPRRSSVSLLQPIHPLEKTSKSQTDLHSHEEEKPLAPDDEEIPLEDEDDDVGDVLVFTSNAPINISKYLHPPLDVSSSETSTLSTFSTDKSTRKRGQGQTPQGQIQGQKAPHSILKKPPIVQEIPENSKIPKDSKKSKSKQNKSKTSSQGESNSEQNSQENPNRPFLDEIPENSKESPKKSKSKQNKSKTSPQGELNIVQDSKEGPFFDENENLSIENKKSRSKSPPSKSKKVLDPNSNDPKTEVKGQRSTSKPPTVNIPPALEKDKEKRSSHRDATSVIPSELFEKVFNLLDSRDLEVCSRVCKRWKRIVDPRLRGPLLFKGKSPYGHFYPRRNCKNFLDFVHKLESRIYRPYELIFRKTCDFQINILCKLRGTDFKSSVKHIQSLQLAQLQCKWKTLIIFLQCFPNLRVLTDHNSNYYTKEGCLIERKKRQDMEKEIKRLEFQDLKYQLKRLKTVKISRKTVDKSLSILFTVLTQGARNVEELEVTLGPYETLKKSNEQELVSSLNHFVKQLTIFMEKNSKTLKKIKFFWADKNFIGYFAKSIEALDKVKLDKLQSLTLGFDKNGTKSGGDFAKLRHFLEYHCAKSLRNFTISNLLLSESWANISTSLDLMMADPIFTTNFNFHLVLSDYFGLQSAKCTLKTLQLQLYQQFTTKVHFSIETEKTKSLAQILGTQTSSEYPRVTSVLVTFEPSERPQTSYDNFNSFCIDGIARNYPNLTELRISDRLIEHQQMFNQVVGKRWKVGMSKASLENKDLQLIAGVLEKLKVLKLWVDLSTVDDHGMTGIHRADLSILLEEDKFYGWENFGHKLEPSFTTLKDLEEVSLRGLGQGVTDITAKFAFENLQRLKTLEIVGDIKISHKGRRVFRRRMKEKDTILLIKQTIA